MNFVIKKDAEPLFSDDPFYDLFNGGYLVLDHFLDDVDRREVHEAIQTVYNFLESLEDSGKLIIG